MIANQIDLTEAARFLHLLDPQTDQFTFQTFDDSDEGRPQLVRIFHGTLVQHSQALSGLNAQGAGIFVTINQTDLHGRKAANIIKVRCYFADTDGAPLKPIIMAARDGSVLPLMLIESSPGNYHVYWEAVCNLNEFRQVQVALAKKFATDKNVIDLPRVLRLPGFYHQKKKGGIYVNECGAFLVRIVLANQNAIVYTPDEMSSGLLLDQVQKAEYSTDSLALNHALTADLKSPPPPETPEEIERVKSMLATIPADCDRTRWLNIIWAIASTGWRCAQVLALEWSATAPDKYDAVAFTKDWNSFNPDGGIGFGTLVHHAKEAGWVDTGNTVSIEASHGDTAGDIMNGKAFADMFRDKLLFVHETGDVLQFSDAAGWVHAQPGEADRAGKEVVAAMRANAAEQWKLNPDDQKVKRFMKHVDQSSTEPKINAMISMAASESGMTRSLNDFDADSMQLGVANGVLDLRGGKLLPVSPSLLVTKRCNVIYDQGATCPQWEQFLADVQPDPEMQKFLQRWVGYCLTGSVQEQRFVFLHGSGANGKSVFVELLAWLLGDYAKKIATEMLMQHQRSPQAASPDIVSLKGRRFVYANETEEGRKLAEAKVKEMTGGDTLAGRVPYGKADITFQPTHKLAIVGNHKPEIGDSSHGMWRRVCLVQFDVTIEEKMRDPKLLEKLKNEGAGILNWSLAGLRKWQQGGLSVPKKIEAATAAYRDEQDTIGEWLAEHCDRGQDKKARKDLLYRAYRKWALDNGHHPLAQRRLTRRLGERGYPILPDKRNIGGLALNMHGMAAA